jgi:NTE family protein
MNPSGTSSAVNLGSGPRLINLALQGGGSHGAFTWGALDALLADGRIDFEGLSGTSAGAMNAVVLAHGLLQTRGQSRIERYEAARQALAIFWNGIVHLGALSSSVSESLSLWQHAPFGVLFGQLGAGIWPGASWTDQLTRYWSSTVSPYQSNPLDINPLKDFLESQVDFGRLAAATHPTVPRVFVVATRVSTGKAEVFSGKRLTAKAVMASACLPMVFRAVEIEGDHFWDGGYTGNPALHPLIYECKSRDIVLVQINPIRRREVPTQPGEIADRVNEITFNAGLVAEMRAIDFVKRLLAEGRIDPLHYKDVLMHRIDGGAALDSYSASTKSSTDGHLIYALRDLGVVSARAWLIKRYGQLGVESTVDIARDYLDDLRLPVERAPSATARVLAAGRLPLPVRKA